MFLADVTAGDFKVVVGIPKYKLTVHHVVQQGLGERQVTVCLETTACIKITRNESFRTKIPKQKVASEEPRFICQLAVCI